MISVYLLLDFDVYLLASRKRLQMKVPLLRCQRGYLTASLSLFDDLKEA